MPRLISPTKIARAAASADPEASSSSSIGQLLEKDCAATYVSESDSDTEYELYDSDFDVELIPDGVTAETSTNANANVRDGVPAVRGRRSHKGYNVGPGSSHHLLVGDDEMHRRSTAIPDLNVELIPDINARQEVPLSQNAPPADDI
jgi:hypothetical protein